MSYNKYLEEDDDLVENSSARIPVCLCLDVSGSMYNAKNELEEGIDAFYNSIKKTLSAKNACEISIVTFSDQATLLEDYSLVEKKSNPVLNIGGGTNMIDGVKMALDVLDDRKQEYKKNGVDYYQPWLIIMSDGAPNYEDDSLYEKTNQLEADKKLVIIPVGIGPNADLFVLSKFSKKRKALKLKGMNFTDFFEWLGRSVNIVSCSNPGDKVKMDSNYQDWLEI